MEVIGKTYQHWKKKLAFMPVEDSFSIDKENKIFCVADGVTRDPSEWLPDVKTLKGQLEFAWNYPRPSPAKAAADIFTSVVPEYIRSFYIQSRGGEVIQNAFSEANREIKRWNEKNMSEIDYLKNDYAGCVGSVALVKDDAVYCVFITDSGVALFDDYVEFSRRRTDNEGPDTKDEFIWQDERLKNASWRNPETRKIIRSEYRNNPLQAYSFGVLTGESSAMSYVKRNVWRLHKRDNLFVYSDGLEKAIFSSEAERLIRAGRRDYLDKYFQSQVSSEGTVIHYRH